MADETSAPLPQPKPWYRLSLTTWIMVGLVAGGFLGFDLPEGTTINQAEEIAAYLNEKINSVSYTK